MSHETRHYTENEAKIQRACIWSSIRIFIAFAGKDEKKNANAINDSFLLDTNTVGWQWEIRQAEFPFH